MVQANLCSVPRGPIPLLNKITTLAAIVFMATSISLAYVSAHKSTGTVMENVQVETLPTLPPLELPVDSNTPITVPAPEQTAETTTAPQEMPVEKSVPQQ